MCGIAGVVRFGGIIAEHRATVGRLTRALAHRGPDAEGLFENGDVLLGHRRLAIVDLGEQAAQPMADADQAVVVAFNGEIYNHRDLRRQLSARHPFRSDHSDTETLLHAYREWGIDALRRLDGMFAAAIYDRRRRQLHLVRDRLGEKPLYYLQHRDGLYFSSELQPLIEAGLSPGEVDPEAVYHYLTLLTTPAPGSYFRGIHKLRAGHRLEVTPEGITEHPYWDIAEHINRTETLSAREATEHTEVLLGRSMALRNVADVPVAIALSGGLDSALNLAYARTHNPTLHALHITFGEGPGQHDESALAQRFSDECSTPLRLARLTPEAFREQIDKQLRQQRDTPMGDPNQVLMHLLGEEAREEGCKVLMVGEGGDELGGYPLYRELEREAPWMRRLAPLDPLWRRLPRLRRLHQFHCGRPISRRHIHAFTEPEKRRMWRGEPPADSYATLAGYMAEIRDDQPDSLLRKVLNIEYKLRLPELILARLDYPTMALGIETRSPYTDHRLVEYSAALPFAVKMADGPKTLLRAVAARHLPDYLLAHPKVGFGMLLTPLLDDIIPEWFRREVIERPAPLHQYLHSEALATLYRQHRARRGAGYRIWALYALNRWLEYHA